MNRLMKAGSVAVAVGGLAAASVAGPLRSNVVSDDATWLIHVNIEALVDSSIGGLLLSEGGPVDIDEIDEMRNELGMDPLEEIFSVTVYGIGDDEESFVAVVRGSSELENALDALIEKAAEGHSSFDEGGRTIHEFSDGNETMYGCLTGSGRSGGRTLTVSPSVERLLASIERMGGRGRSDLVHGRGPGENSFVYISAAEIPGMPRNGPASMILRAARGVTVDVGESADQMYIHGAIQTADAEKAVIVMQAIDGLKAMAMLLGGSDPDMQPYVQLLGGLNVGLEGDTLTASFQIGTEMLAGLLDESADWSEGSDEGDDDDSDYEDDDGDDRLRQLEEKLRRLERLLEEKGERRH